MPINRSSHDLLENKLASKKEFYVTATNNYMARKSKLNFEEHKLEAKDKQNCEVNSNLQQEEEKLKST